MPVIQCDTREGWTDEQKSSLAEGITKVVGETGNVPIHHIHVVIREPVGCSIFPKEIFKASEHWLKKRFSNLVHYNVLDKGGHFAAFEQPAAFVDEIRTCFRTLR